MTTTWPEYKIPPVVIGAEMTREYTEFPGRLNVTLQQGIYLNVFICRFRSVGELDRFLKAIMILFAVVMGRTVPMLRSMRGEIQEVLSEARIEAFTVYSEALLCVAVQGSGSNFGTMY